MVAILISILGLAVLMVVHELGHHLVARAYKLRVVRFSIGFGPPLWKHQPKGSDTVYQVALIPFLAYVQVAGMNPFEESDPDDKGSYANASLTARILTIAGGSLANYGFAMVLFFGAFMAFGEPVPTNLSSTAVTVMPDTPAEAAHMQDGDKVLAINGVELTDFEHMRDIIVDNPSKPLAVSVLRDGKTIALTVTPEAKGENGGGLIGVRPVREYRPMSLNEALEQSVAMPAMVVRDLVVGLWQLATREAEPEVAGPVKIVKYSALMVEAGGFEIIFFLARLSAYLAGFNLLPIPALDGGRLIFLAYEVVARRKPNAKIEAQIHAVGLLMFLALLAVVTVKDFQN